MGRLDLDEFDRLPPGSTRGWGYSWWLIEQGIRRVDFLVMTPDERMALGLRYLDAVEHGWAPDVAPSEWVGPHHPSAPAPVSKASAND